MYHDKHDRNDHNFKYRECDSDLADCPGWRLETHWDQPPYDPHLVVLAIVVDEEVKQDEDALIDERFLYEHFYIVKSTSPSAPAYTNTELLAEKARL